MLALLMGLQRCNYTIVNESLWVLTGSDQALSYGRRMGAPAESELNLKQVAAELGVHYMTAYRYIRTGRLAARKVGTGWVVTPEHLREFVDRQAVTVELLSSDENGADWRERLRRTLVTGDETAAWRVIEQALAAGQSPISCYLDLIVGAINEISDRGHAPERPLASEYLATATASRLVARLGARFRRPGRTRGTVIFGAPLGEHHTLPISVVADLVRLEGFNCLELGANVPAEAFAGAALDDHRLVAVGIGVTTGTDLDAVCRIVESVRAVDSRIPIVIGGQAAQRDGMLAHIGADASAADGIEAVRIFRELATARRHLWLQVESEEDPSESGDFRTA
jgi:excisionase family DNA binding protein